MPEGLLASVILNFTWLTNLFFFFTVKVKLKKAVSHENFDSYYIESIKHIK